MIKVVSLDIGGTLIKGKKSNYNLKALTDLINLPSEDVRKAYKDVFQKMNGDFDTLTNIFCERLNIEKTDELINFFKHLFLDNNSDTISDKDTKIIKKIKELGYKVILFSNSTALFKHSNDLNKILPYIDGIFYSYEMGYTKSDAESYRYIEQKLNVAPNEFLHIGDTLRSDYLEPINNGWNAIYYGSCDDNNVLQINDLEDILNYLNSKNKLK